MGAYLARGDVGRQRRSSLVVFQERAEKVDEEKLEEHTAGTGEHGYEVSQIMETLTA